MSGVSKCTPVQAVLGEKSVTNDVDIHDVSHDTKTDIDNKIEGDVVPTLDRIEDAKELEGVAEEMVPTLGLVKEEPETVFPPISTWKAVILVGLTLLSAMMQVMSGIGTSITIADIGSELVIPSGQLQWVASAGSLATACTLLVMGKLADMYGHKPVFVIGCTIGGAMFLGMGLAREKYSFFVFRALGGVAFAG